ncbi:IclR family transcriptional regulator C-terminal domain-containing protein [Microbacterium pseudoresistens]|uniref:Glycerol operon regulatory protein n=1 Tax=Microbacterium pseudoresistens TaxID=640634 RepID=A0A7Y9JPG0_9MICO|nr:IclR family transcriptional regulator C-terminal domain-containing protein [Microbacterium pseudoresistens]NYD54609.1 IclR family pca regulon transcriptional regulator [Microbacterium pseudoresistens]
MSREREGAGPDFVEALARGLEVIECFRQARPRMTLSEVATASGLARPTARRILLTLETLGYVRTEDGGFRLTPRVLDLGLSYIASQELWEAARPHMQQVVETTNESCSIAQLDGSDIVYVARVSVPKIVTLAVSLGTRFPALATSLGMVQLAALAPEELHQALSTPSRASVTARWQPEEGELAQRLREVRAQGWAIADEYLALGIRSVAAPIRDGDGRVVAAVNVNTHAAETSLDILRERHLPVVLRAASLISGDLARFGALPAIELPR